MSIVITVVFVVIVVVVVIIIIVVVVCVVVVVVVVVSSPTPIQRILACYSANYIASRPLFLQDVFVGDDHMNPKPFIYVPHVKGRCQEVRPGFMCAFACCKHVPLILLMCAFYVCARCVHARRAVRTSHTRVSSFFLSLSLSSDAQI